MPWRHSAPGVAPGAAQEAQWESRSGRERFETLANGVGRQHSVSAPSEAITEADRRIAHVNRYRWTDNSTCGVYLPLGQVTIRVLNDFLCSVLVSLVSRFAIPGFLSEDQPRKCMHVCISAERIPFFSFRRLGMLNRSIRLNDVYL